METEKEKLRKEVAQNYNGKKTDQIIVLVSEEDLKRIDENAKQYAEGNRSKWVRFASANWKLKGRK